MRWYVVPARRYRLVQQASSDRPPNSRLALSRREAGPGEDDTDILSVLTCQHDQVTALLQQVKAIPGVSKGGSPTRQAERASIVDTVTAAVAGSALTRFAIFYAGLNSAEDPRYTVAPLRHSAGSGCTGCGVRSAAGMSY